MSNVGRPAVQQNAILEQLRTRIVSGSIPPGGRLPSHRDIQREFNCTRVTVQRALDRLADEGFVRAAPKIGRFVADRPPHLSRYALVFDSMPDPHFSGVVWSRFYTAILEASRIVAARRNITIAPYLGVNGHPDSEGQLALQRDLDRHRLAGVMFAFATFPLQGTKLIEERNPPRVNAHPLWLDVTRVLDDRRFIYRAIDTLLADGRSRFAVITKPDMTRGFPDEYEAAIASHGGRIVTHPFWTQAVEPHQTRWVRHAVHAILSTQPENPPDAMLVPDDHLVEPVAEALLEFGVRVPQQMRVIGHWNFPNPYRGAIPIELLGFDAVELVESWVDAIDAQRRGEKVVGFATTPARFAHEIPSKNHLPVSASVTAADLLIEGRA